LQHKELIEKAGAEFRIFNADSDYLSRLLPSTIESAPDKMTTLNCFLHYANLNTSGVVNGIENEQPDLILVDGMAYYAKFALRVLVSKKNKQSAIRYKSKDKDPLVQKP
jgi:hypothetical protein